MLPRFGNLNKDYPKRKNDNGKWLCRWCGSELTGRKTSWCGPQCSDEVFIRCWPGHASFMVWQRDRGICSNCGLDTEKRRDTLLKIRRRFGFEIFNAIQMRYRKLGFPPVYQSWWEADHIIPVSEGGGQCGLNNYRTLCVPCHKAETAALRKRLSQIRRNRRG